MDKKIYDAYINILKSELVPALGCTEPIAIAFAGAKVRETLGEMPDFIEVKCSGNIIKNVKGVTVPNSGGLRGIDSSATLGVVGGDVSRELEVLKNVTDEHRKKTVELLKNNFCKCELIEGEENLQIYIYAQKGDSSASVEIKGSHTNITNITKNGETIFSSENADKNLGDLDKDLLNVKDILTFAKEVKIEEIEAVIKRQIEMNVAIANEGMKNNYGVSVGKTLLENYNIDVKLRAKAMAAAGSDARMSGCSMPVVTNSGSGNQGITVCLPVVEYAKELQVSEDTLYRALLLSNLIAILQKYHIGKLSAFCGAVSAASGAASGIAFLYGYDYKEISDTITNTLGSVGGMVCDGAKASCAAKIATALDTAIMAFMLAKNNRVFKNGEGLVKEDIEATIDSVGRMGREGMKATDIEILNIMIDK